VSHLVFSVDSALLSELGEKLVETVHIALVELVKNSYDADATEVVIKFRFQKKKGHEIYVIDNGTGMSFREVRNYWMRIATTVKQANRISRLYGRPKTGSKGIGRFCARRLGSHLQLITTAHVKNGRFEKTEVTFPWKRFKAGTEVTSIKCSGSSKTIDDRKTGTTLVISDSVKDEWKERGYKYLKRQLAILVANRGVRRKGFKEDPGFNIILDVPQFEGGDIKDLREEIIGAGWGTVSAKIDKRGHAACHLKALDIGEKNITSVEKFSHLAGVVLKVGIIPDKKEQMRNPSLLSKYNLRRILPNWGGVQVRYNGFRVYPYGDNDWLKIDRDRGRRIAKPTGELYTFAEKLRGVDPKRALLSLLSMRGHVGTVEIGLKASGFEMKASREGFVHTRAFDELQYFVRYAIDWATVYRDFYMRKRAKQKSEMARKSFEKIIDRKVAPDLVVENAVGFIQDEFKNISNFLPDDEKSKTKKSLLRAVNAILKKEELNKQELQHLRFIASTATLLLIFTHETKSLLGLLTADVGQLSSIMKKLSVKDARTVDDIRKDLLNARDRFLELFDMTSLIGIQSRTTKPSRLALKERAVSSVNCFRLIRERYDIKIVTDKIPNKIMVGPMLEAELYAILLNPLSNSIKSIIAADKQKLIEIAAKRINGNTIINIRDTGLGLDEKHLDDVFIPFVADPSGRLYEGLDRKLNPEDKYIVGTGSGLGLSIVKEILRNYKGSVRFCEPSSIWKADLEIVLP
jgi:signal transduction histidine kinase